MGAASKQPLNTQMQSPISDHAEGVDSANLPASQGSIAAPGASGPALPDEHDRQVTLHACQTM